MNLEIRIDDLATPRLQALLRGLSPEQRRAMMGRLGKALEVRLKAHFLQRNDTPNKKGWPRQNWWSREVWQKTALRSYDADSAVVGIASRQFAFRQRGGTIKPGPGKKYLAIPARAEAYGKRPSQNGVIGLFFVRSRATGRAFLATREGKGGALRVYWRLVRSVTQAADPQALPPVEELKADLVRSIDKEIGRILEQYPAGAGGT